MKFSYVDDIGIIGVSNIVAESTAAAQRKVEEFLGWARQNAVSFDIGKLEVIHFNGRQRENLTGARILNTQIEPTEHIKWLGNHLDPRLTFKHHVTCWCRKALKAAQHMMRLSPVKRGSTLCPLAQIIDICIILVASYGSELWWPGIRRITDRVTATSRTAHLCELINKVFRMALRAALPV